ncbi:uncharacterized protein LOC114354826 [Ostrinia furnacalis]|uniref:uncharacterized protein LOC114354826 n=1 Tax=Ostrinia furnacalis TaxID=93504 RepID=UPI00103AEBDB|nr:uncharacterized protein LOC114354826 [Ostrinia furnacalis]
MKCAMCNSAFNDGAQCGSCKRHLDFACANISETAYRKLRSDRRAAWRCPACKSSSPHSSIPASPESASLEVILNEIRGIKLQLTSLSTLLEDVRAIKSEIADLKTASEFSSAKIDEHAARLATVESSLPAVARIQETISATQEALCQVKNESSSKGQWARLNNVEIKGVPMRKGENLFSVVGAIAKRVGYEFPKTQINYVSRIPIHNSKDKSIIICFINRYVKEEFVAAARAMKTITANEIGFSGNSDRIFVNDHLTSEYKKLLTKTKSALKAKDYRYIWIKYGKIHVRKNDTSHVVVIHTESDLNRLV